MQETRKILVKKADQLAELCRKVQSADSYGFDSESAGPSIPDKDMVDVHRSTLVGCSFGFRDATSYYVPLGHKQGSLPPTTVQALSQAMNDNKTGTCWIYGAKHDLHAIGRAPGFHLDQANIRCAHVLMWLQHQRAPGKNPFNLKKLVKYHYNVDLPQFEEVAKGRGFDELTPQEALDYACDDSTWALQIGDDYLSRLWNTPVTRAAWDRETAMVRVLHAIEKRGMPFNAQASDDLEWEFRIEQGEIEEAWQKLLGGIEWDLEVTKDGERVTKSVRGVSISSPQQLVQFFVKGKHWPEHCCGRTESGEVSVNAEALEAIQKSRKTTELGKKAVDLKLRWQFLSKNTGTYTSGLVQFIQADGRIHPHFNQAFVVTGRLSCSDPNLQNIPARTEEGRRIKALFRPSNPDHRLILADYSQIELRVLCHLVGRGALLRGYQTGQDVHQITADALGISRYDGKTYNFAQVYGAGDKKLANTFGKTRKEVKSMGESFRSANPEIFELKARIIKAGRERGYVRTMGGRYRPLDVDLLSLPPNDPKRWSEERIAFNTPIQGGAADIVKEAMVQLHKRGIPMIGQIHDDVPSEAHKSECEDIAKIKKEVMENAWELKCPLVVKPEIKEAWA